MWRNRNILSLSERDLLKVEETVANFTAKEYTLSYSYDVIGEYRFIITRLRLDLLGVNKIEVKGRTAEGFTLTLTRFDKSYFSNEPIRVFDYDLFNFFLIDVRKTGGGTQTGIRVEVEWDASATVKKYFLLIQGFLFEKRW